MERRNLLVVGIFIFVVIFGGYYGLKDIRFENSKEYREVQELQNVSWNFEVYRNYFIDLAKEKGSSRAFEVLRRASIPTGVDVHNLAHFVGYELYQERDIEGITKCTDEFSNACSHAIVIQTFIDLGEKALETIVDACAQAPGDNTYALCFHGLGHGILAYLDYELEEAIPICERASKFAPEQQQAVALSECVGGTIMEITSGLHDVKARDSVVSKYLPDDDLLMPCNSNLIPDATKPFCYVYLTGRFLESSGAVRGAPSPEAYAKAFSWCDRIPEKETENRNACYGGFGKDFVYFAADGDVRKVLAITENQLTRIHDWCSLAGSESGERSCVLSAADTLYWLGAQISLKTFCTQASNGNTEKLCLERLNSFGGTR